MTAFASVLTAILLVPLVPKALALPSPEQLRLANAKLQEEINERKLAQAELACKAEELERALVLLKEQQEALVRSEKLATVGQLAASVGHELRNPLAAVGNALTYISRRVLAPEGAPDPRQDPRVRTLFGIAERELKVSAKIITDLLDFSRERKPDRQFCPLRPLVNEAIEVVPKGAVQVENLVPESLPVPSLDRDQFRQVLVNLIQNAVDATPADSPHPVKVEAEGDEKGPLKVIVTDRGRGVPDELASKIFEPLFTTKVKGTGLGLAIVQGIVRGHGGEIALAGADGGGTTFTVTLPLSPDAPGEGS
jgi:two-component system, NtrC family, sensor histidine kinase HydH